MQTRECAVPTVHRPKGNASIFLRLINQPSQAGVLASSPDSVHVQIRVPLGSGAQSRIPAFTAVTLPVRRASNSSASGAALHRDGDPTVFVTATIGQTATC